MKQNEKLYNVIFYFTKDGRKMLYAYLEEDYSYGFYYSEFSKKWEFSVIDFEMLEHDFGFEKITEEHASKIADTKKVKKLFEKMFGFKIG